MTGAELLGIVASFATIVSGFGWFIDRNTRRTQSLMQETHGAITKVEKDVKSLADGLNDLRVLLPTNFVTKQELLQHIQGEERWHEHTTERLRDIQEEITSLRYRSHP